VSRFDADSRDPGLAAERTDLAWNRSNLSLLACGVVVMRGIARPPLTTGNVAVGLAIVALGAFTWILGVWRVHRSRARGTLRTTRADVLPIALGAAVVGVAAFVVAAFFPS
jgi:uncharacterized membrane protein YidH (DUF202 family)